jgi:hypothetical protein
LGEAAKARSVEESDASTIRPARRRLRVAAALVALLALLLVGIWAARRPIAGAALDRELRRAGVPARYQVETLDLGRQRLRDVVIGDPARPDLVADWVETGTRIGWTGAVVTTVRAGRVRLRGRWVDGRVSWGTLDRLLGPPTGRPFTLPALVIDVADARVRLETPSGLVGFKISGRGRLDDGFDGRVAAVSARVDAGGCTAERAEAVVRVTVADGAPRLVGPLRAASLRCRGGGAERPRADADLVLTPSLDGWRGRARVASADLTLTRARASSVAGTVTFGGNARATSGEADVAFGDAAGGGATARRFSLDGFYRVGRETGFDGRVRGEGVAVSPMRLDADALAGTPVGPIAKAIAVAVERAGRDFAVDADLALDIGKGAAVRVRRIAARSASGARVRLDGGDGVGWSRAGLRVDGTAVVGGGGLPGMRVVLDQAAPGAPLRGLARIAPMSAGGSGLALSPVSFTAGADGTTRIAATATLSGPLGGGRVDGLSAPLALSWDGRAALLVNPACTPVSFGRLAVSGFVAGPTRVSLCPTGRALFRVAGRNVSGGARIAAPRLAGRIGSTPVALAASGAEVALSDGGFVVRDLAARIGTEGRVTRIDVGELRGRAGDGGLAGRFADTGGRIANVPLLLSGASGVWRLQDGALTLTGSADVAETGGRFEPMRSEDVAFRLAGGRIAVTSTLLHPASRREVVDVRIAHDLSRGSGEALLDVAGVSFDERLQPEALTRLAFGVVADVRGSVRGQGRIAWDPAAVTSTGEFRTDGVDLAAAFGPVEGLAGTIVFDDLLSLRSAPGQVVRVRSLNPGIAVTDGEVRYRTLPDARVQVEGGRWPFAGGTLTLEPTLLDFGQARPKLLTFRVAGMEAGQFLQQFDFDNLNATGVFDGVLPMIFDERGGRIEEGRLAVRDGGGTIAYVGELTQKDLGFWGDLAFQSLRALRYRDLDMVMNGPLAGEMVTEVRFAGVSQGEGTKSNFLIRRLQRLPLVFNIRVKAPFRGLIDSARGFYDPARLIQRNLPALIEEQNRRAQPPVIQPPASRNMP